MLAPAPRGRRLSRTFHLPGPAAPRPAGAPGRFGEHRLEVASLDPAAIDEVLGGLRDARRDLVATAPAERRRSLVRAARRFLVEGEEPRETAIALLPGVTGFSPPMIREALDRIFGEVREDALVRAGTDAGEATHALVGIVSAGNVPGVAIPGTTLALAAGAACFVKPSAGEPLLAVLFAEALAAESAVLGRALGVAWWKGGSVACDRALARGVDSLVAYGSDEALASLDRLGPPAFVGYGHRLSAALVRLDRTTDLEAAANAAALDVALYDQLGCLSPQVVFAVGDRERRSAFAAALAAALSRLAERLPRGPVPEAVAVAIRAWRDEAEWRALAGEDVHLYASPGGTDWTVVDEPQGAFRPGPLHRSVPVVPLRTPEGLSVALADARGVVECLGTLPFPDPEAAFAARRAGIATVAPLGKMQQPALDRRAGGRSPLAGIVRDR